MAFGVALSAQAKTSSAVSLFTVVAFIGFTSVMGVS
jgi:hypothetical protein